MALQEGLEVHEVTVPPSGGDAAVDTSSSATGTALSKNQQKKLARRQRVEAHREEKRAQEKLQKEQDKARRIAEWESLTEEEKAAKRQKRLEMVNSQRETNAEQKRKFLEAMQAGPRVVIDLDFEEMMDARSLRSMCQQVMFSYAILKKAVQPLNLSVCGLSASSTLRQTLFQKTGASSWPIVFKSTPFYEEHSTLDCVVYLTADSDRVLRGLEMDKVYIIGGLVDHNRHQGLTLQRAIQHGVKHAKLPLQEYMDHSKTDKFSRVLTVDHMVAVLCAFLETRDWAQAFQRAIPSRKQATFCGSDGSLSEGGGEAPPPAEEAACVEQNRDGEPHNGVPPPGE
eukprot:RCo049676